MRLLLLPLLLVTACATPPVDFFSCAVDDPHVSNQRPLVQSSALERPKTWQYQVRWMVRLLRREC